MSPDEFTRACTQFDQTLQAFLRENAALTNAELCARFPDGGWAAVDALMGIDMQLSFVRQRLTTPPSIQVAGHVQSIAAIVQTHSVMRELPGPPGTHPQPEQPPLPPNTPDP